LIWKKVFNKSSLFLPLWTLQCMASWDWLQTSQIWPI
jgi:hypothetical protein